MNDLTQIIGRIDQGDPSAAELLLPLVYKELRSLAAQRLRHEKPGQTLQATELVHEAYLRLVDADDGDGWNGRGHFFAAAAEAMRRILVENARRRSRVRNGGGHRRAPLKDIPAREAASPETILAIDEAITHLANSDPAVANIIKLHFFAGMTLDETAESLGMSRATVYRQWAYARATLRLTLEGGPAGTDS